jgi:hypothetical protein
MESSCQCPRLNEAEWQHRKHTWERRAFYRTSHGLFLHMPIGIGGAIRRGMDAIKAKGYTVEPPYMMLEDETGLFSADILIALKEMPENDPNVVVWPPATLYSLYYHGEFRGLSQQVRALREFFESEEKRKPRKIYTWTADCPKCWKERGGPTTVLFATA